MKIVKEGYIGRTEGVDEYLTHEAHVIRLVPVFRHKLRRHNWYTGQWPPKKVRITIEEID